ncbi:MAG TPA: ribosome biogenesis GTP-binding protein YihA/YsxC [Spirochaetota bacterium]|nr:ribosome biogenesis GTP-binding protein YihA/YsxC [Spirochaetota bacterium]HPI90652.1 ribosome biogenesis GTP-binding protein YihA/YsxC [Spirochaetota bacterium]HPR49696.1 ribosome biogenesis GTP-binding protein YihA/YsxC [Spirochaetota bacterium]
MKIKKVYFLKSCTKPADYPDYRHPEFAFFGRSNAGKSSLINMLLNRKDLVKTGQKPGVTRTINFFVLNDSISLVDLPGYGYARISKDQSKGFMPMLTTYISKRDNLRAAFVLMDIRRVPEAFEHEIITSLHSRKIPVAITLTKCDKLSKNQREKQVRLIEAELGVGRDSIFFTSSKSGEGKRDILRIISEAAFPGRDSE